MQIAAFPGVSGVSAVSSFGSRGANRAARAAAWAKAKALGDRRFACPPFVSYANLSRRFNGHTQTHTERIWIWQKAKAMATAKASAQLWSQTRFYPF